MIIYAIKDCSNYDFYHWFIYAISSLYKIRDISGQVYFTVPMNGLEFQLSSLKYLAHTYIYTTDPGHIINLDETLHLDENNCPKEKEIYPFLRSNFLEKNSFPDIKPLSRLVYISRDKSNLYKNRRVLNESSFKEILIERGFEFIYLEDLCFDDKVKLFMEAKLIITPCGGAMTLGIFMNKAAKMIEIIPVNIFLNHFADIYKELDLTLLQYNNVQAVNQGGNDINHMDPFANMRINDIGEFLSYIETVRSQD